MIRTILPPSFHPKSLLHFGRLTAFACPLDLSILSQSRTRNKCSSLCSLILFAAPLPAVLSRCFRSWQTALEECCIFLGFRFSSHLAPTAFHLPHGMHSRPLLPQGPVGNPALKRSKSRYACFGFLRTCAPDGIRGCCIFLQLPVYSSWLFSFWKQPLALCHRW